MVRQECVDSLRHLAHGAGSEGGASGLQDGKLYWCDARTDKIERIDLETGEDREVVLSSNNMDMFSVSVFEEFIYWSDRWASARPSPGPQLTAGSWPLASPQDSCQRLHQAREQGQRHRLRAPANGHRRPAQRHQSLQPGPAERRGWGSGLGRRGPRGEVRPQGGFQESMMRETQGW